MNEIWPPRDMRKSPAIMREFEPVTYIHIALQQEISSARQGQSASQASLHHFHCHIL